MRPSFRRPTRRRLAVAGVPAVGLALVATLVPASGEEPAAARPRVVLLVLPGRGRRAGRDRGPPRGHRRRRARRRRRPPARSVRRPSGGTSSAPRGSSSTTAATSRHRAEGEADEVARAFVADHAGLFKLSAGAVDSLEVVTDSPLLEGPDLVRQQQGEQVATDGVPHVVTFRQTFADGLVAGNDGLLTVGVQRDGRVAYVSSSVTGDEEVSGSRSLDAVAALQEAADDAGLDLGRLTGVEADGPWTTFTSSLTSDLQRARLMAVPTPTDGTRLAWETTLLSSDHASDDHGPAALHQLRRRRDRPGPAARQPGRPPRRGPRPPRRRPVGRAVHGQHRRRRRLHARSGTARTPSPTAPARSPWPPRSRPRTAPTTTS